MVFSDTLLVFNVILGVVIFANSVFYWSKTTGSYRWFKLFRGSVSLYIAGVYGSMTLGDYQNTVSFTAIYLRPAITLLLVTLVIGAIYDLRKWRK